MSGPALQNGLGAQEVVEALGLRPHPEGGFYRETFRDARLPASDRAASTAIYFLLCGGKNSAWHKIDSAELWFYHAGAPLLLSLSPDGKTLTNYRLGSDLLAGERPQGLVPPHCWQAARSLGDWTLVSCTVAPGFEFAKFELAAPDFSPKEERGAPN
jgi:predicted cupin superfamily sugar epimerase